MAEDLPRLPDEKCGKVFSEHIMDEASAAAPSG
jgi:hypothetical protein